MIQIISILTGFSLLLIILFLMYKNLLRKEYSILWLLLTNCILLFSFWREGIDKLAAFLGVYYAPALFFILGFIMTCSVLLHLTVVVSSLKNQVRILSQKIALLEKDKTN